MVFRSSNYKITAEECEEKIYQEYKYQKFFGWEKMKVKVTMIDLGWLFKNRGSFLGFC